MALPILVVDDDPFMRRALARWLAGAGYDVACAGSCKEAKMLDGPFAAAVLDLELGDGWGTHLARELLASNATQQIVFYSGTRDEAFIDHAREVGPVFDKAGGWSSVLRMLHELTAAES